MNDLQLVPFHSHEIEERLKSFKKLNMDVCKVLPDVLLAEMNMLFDKYQKIKSNEYIPARYQDNAMDQVRIVYILLFICMLLLFVF